MWIAIGVSSLFAGAAVAQTSLVSIEAAAEVSEQAERIPPPTTVPEFETTGGDLLFPIEPFPTCEVFNNFGGFSKYFGPGGHQGLDIGTDFRQEVYAVEDGVLTEDFEGSGSGLGWSLVSDTDVKYRYFHLDELEPGLAIGSRVAEGDRIGWVGDTGNAASGGWHLHFEVRPDAPHKTPVDPLPLLAVPDVCNVYPATG